MADGPDREALYHAYEDAWPQRSGADPEPFLALVRARGLMEETPPAVVDRFAAWWREGVPPRRIGWSFATWAVKETWGPLVKLLWSERHEIRVEPREFSPPDDRRYVNRGDPDDPDWAVDEATIEIHDATLDPTGTTADFEARLRRTRPLDEAYGCSAWFVATETADVLDVMVGTAPVGRIEVPHDVWAAVRQTQADGIFANGSLSLAVAPGSVVEVNVVYSDPGRSTG